MSLAYRLNYVPDPVASGQVDSDTLVKPRYKPVDVDLLFLMDPENDLRGAGFIFNSVNSPDSLTPNVRIAVNVYAEDWHTLPWGWDFPGNPQNGMNRIRGAVNIGLSQSTFEDGTVRTTTHWNVVQQEGSLNQTVKGLLTDQVELYFTGYDGQ
jgi:hypothetical protein